MLHVLKTIDAHVAGEPLRLITEGLPRPAGKTMAQKCDWMKRHADQLRRALVLEPRGHRDMCAALLTEPVSPGADAGIIFLQNDGYSAISGHGIIAVATIALERGLFPSTSFGTGPSTSLASFSRDAPWALLFDTVAGTVHARLRGNRMATGAALTWSRSRTCRHCAQRRPSRVGARELRVDIAFGGVLARLPIRKRSAFR
jgi:proline racemase